MARRDKIEAGSLSGACSSPSRWTRPRDRGAITRRLEDKHDGQGFVDGRYHHLFVVPATGGDVTQLTSGAWDVSGFDWSPDGKQLVSAGNAEPNADLQR